jgi:glucokinase
MASARQLVFDVGGTQLRAAIYDGANDTLSEVLSVEAPSFVKHPGLSWDELRGRLVGEMTALRACLDAAEPALPVVIAFPGPVDGERRVVAAPTLWGALGAYPHALELEWPGSPVRVLNDVSAAGYRYLRGLDDHFCVVTVSTGIGNKVFVGGRPLVGPHGKGGEIGHLQIDPSPTAASCDCGGRGHLGAIASGRGLVARAKECASREPESFRRSILATELGHSPLTVSAEALAIAFGRHDAWATDRVTEAATALGAVLAGMHLAIGTERFVLIGGLAVGLGAPFSAAVSLAAASRCWVGSKGGFDVTLGASDGRCALVGAGRAGARGWI